MKNQERDQLGMTLEYDPFTPYDDPYEIYRELRDEAPLYRNEHRGFWALSRFEDVQGAARDWETFTSGEGMDVDATGELYQPGDGAFIELDPPRHDVLRRFLHDEFKPARLKARLTDTITDRTRTLLAEFRRDGSADFARDLAWVLPTYVVFSWLGFPEADHPRLRRYLNGINERVPGKPDLPPTAYEARAELAEYIEQQARQRQEQPRDDLLSTMVAGIDPGVVDMDAVVGMCVLIFFAGTTTTTTLLGEALMLLGRHPDQRAELARDPERIPQAIEEVLRYDAPVQVVRRTTTRAVELHGTTIPAGESVLLLLGAANRDERRWPDADRFDIGREKKRHAAFGEGIHHCIGAPLSRLEGGIVLGEILKTIPDYEIEGPVERGFTPSEHPIERLPVAFQVAPDGR
jgi:cytochrome P450